jgi:hypothetical protein
MQPDLEIRAARFDHFLIRCNRQAYKTTLLLKKWFKDRFQKCGFKFLAPWRLRRLRP